MQSGSYIVRENQAPHLTAEVMVTKVNGKTFVKDMGTHKRYTEKQALEDIFSDCTWKKCEQTTK